MTILSAVLGEGRYETAFGTYNRLPGLIIREMATPIPAGTPIDLKDTVEYANDDGILIQFTDGTAIDQLIDCLQRLRKNHP